MTQSPNEAKSIDEILNLLSGKSFDAAINNPKDYAQIVINAEIEAKQAILCWVADEVIGAPLEIDVSWRPTLEDPYGIAQIKNQTRTPKTIISAESYETIKR